MNRYIVEVTLAGVNPNQFEALAAKEQEVVAEFVETGFIDQIYVRNDLSGAYLVVREHDESQVKEKFTRFPMFPYMTLKMTQLQN
jgi:muconolactone delta-isomerase